MSKALSEGGMQFRHVRWLSSQPPCLRQVGKAAFAKHAVLVSASEAPHIMSCLPQISSKPLPFFPIPDSQGMYCSSEKGRKGVGGHRGSVRGDYARDSDLLLAPFLVCPLRRRWT